MGTTDQRKLDEYLTGVRDLEYRLSRPHDESKSKPTMAKPSGTPQDFGAHIKLMADLLVLAFQADLTRVATFVFANDGSNRSYPMIGVSDGHHDVSHHGRDTNRQTKIKKINLFHTQQLAYFLRRLKSVKEGSTTLLDQSMIVYGSGISDGDRHNHDDLPILLAGRGGGALRQGRHLKYSNNTPLMNLHLSLLDRIGAPTSKLGHSTGRLPGLS